MAVCSFLGHRHIYGHDVQLRLQAAVNHLVEENDSVEFLLYLWKSTEPFYALCLLAALRAKQCAPQKVTLTLVADRLELEQRLADKWTHPLFFIADRLLPLSVSKDRNPLKVLKRTVQWMVKQSTHVINGFYEDLFDRDDFVLNFARNAGVQIINVTAPELEQVILASSEQLPERQRLVFQMRKSGYTQKEIAMHLNLTVSRVQQIEAAVTKNLQKQLDSISSCIPKIPQKLSVCSIFALGDANYKNLCVFSNCIRFLMTRYQIDQFCLAAIIQAHLIYQLAHKCQRSGRGLRFGAGLPEKSGLPDRKKQTLAVWHDLGLDGVPDAVLKHRGAEGKEMLFRLVDGCNRPPCFC